MQTTGEYDKYRIRDSIIFADGQLSPKVYRQRYPDFGKSGFAPADFAQAEFAGDYRLNFQPRFTKPYAYHFSISAKDRRNPPCCFFSESGRHVDLKSVLNARSGPAIRDRNFMLLRCRQARKMAGKQACKMAGKWTFYVKDKNVLSAMPESAPRFERISKTILS